MTCSRSTLLCQQLYDLAGTQAGSMKPTTSAVHSGQLRMLLQQADEIKSRISNVPEPLHAVRLLLSLAGAASLSCFASPRPFNHLLANNAKPMRILLHAIDKVSVHIVCIQALSNNSKIRHRIWRIRNRVRCGSSELLGCMQSRLPVSYTHLTLPTIYSV